MSKRGEAALYIFLAFSVVALFGLTYTMLAGQPQGMWGVDMDCQSSCFGTERGEPLVGQESLGGSKLRQCMSDCQAGISDEQTLIQECYTCNDGGVVQKLTAEDQTQAQATCEKVAGSEATIDETKTVPGLCPY